MAFTFLQSKTVWWLDLIISFWPFEYQIICFSSLKPWKKRQETIMSHETLTNVPQQCMWSSHTKLSNPWVILRFVSGGLAPYCVGKYTSSSAPKSFPKIKGDSRDSQGHGTPFMVSFTYYSHTIPISLGIRTWEWYGSHVLGGPWKSHGPKNHLGWKTRNASNLSILPASLHEFKI